MSELIVRMEMNGIPDCCGLCDPLFRVVCATKHDQTIDKMMLRVGRPSWCPIIGELPEQHGRLGDLDKLANMVNSARVNALLRGSNTDPYWLFGDMILQAKTIIPAERSET